MCEFSNIDIILSWSSSYQTSFLVVLVSLLGQLDNLVYLTNGAVMVFMALACISLNVFKNLLVFVVQFLVGNLPQIFWLESRLFLFLLRQLFCFIYGV